MANWCNNIVTFEGDSEKLKSINILFQQMREKEKAEEKVDSRLAKLQNFFAEDSEEQ